MVKKNYKYGKIINEKLEYAPNIIKGTRINSQGKEIFIQIINGSEEQYRAQGWYSIINTPAPESTEEGYYIPKYELINEQIIQSWKFIEYEPQE